jgi:hypothetical protein
MDHRITTAIVVCVGGTLAFTLMLALFSSSVPSGAGAATAADHAAPSAPHDRLATVLRQLDSAAYRFRRQHGGLDPDFAANHTWDQFLQPTDPQGRVVKAQGPEVVGPPPRTFAPYLETVPVNPLNGRSNVVVTAGNVDAGDRVASGPAGFVYSTARGRFYGTDETGKAVAAVVTPP